MKVTELIEKLQQYLDMDVGDNEVAVVVVDGDSAYARELAWHSATRVQPEVFFNGPSGTAPYAALHVMPWEVLTN